MNIFEYAIAKEYFRLLAEQDARVLTMKETHLVAALAPSVERYEARETRQISGAAR